MQQPPRRLPEPPLTAGIFARLGRLARPLLDRSRKLLGRSRLPLPAYPELDNAWRAINARLREVVDDSTYDIWLAELEPRAIEGTVLLLGGPESRQSWILKRFGRLLEACTRAVLGEEFAIRFDGAAGAVSAGGRAARSGEKGHRHGLEILGSLNPRYSFSQFVIGEGNRLAHAAALAVAEYPGQAYNPLFLQAPPGLGKTHLLHAIGNYVLAFGGGATVRYTTVEDFTNHFLSSLVSRSVDQFKHTYRDVDVLLIDDVQFLASKAKTEEEFFHTFNALYESGRQLVITCDRLPRQLQSISDRLRERFDAGLVTEIHPPDLATRLTILRKRAALDHVALAQPGVLELIAERVTDNVRALEGTLIRIVAHHSLTGHPIDVELTSRVLDAMYPGKPPATLNAERIQAVVASFYGIPPRELVSPKRTAEVAWPRQLAIYLTRKLTDTPLTTIGDAFGGRSHATVLHACKRVREKIEADSDAAGDVEQLTASLRARGSDRSC